MPDSEMVETGDAEMGRDEEEDRRAESNDASEEAQRSARRRNEGDDKLNGPRSSATKSLPKSVSARNRRLKKMNQLVEEGEYFSLGNMERRAPLLYHEHIGRFMEEGEGVSKIVPTDKPSCILVDEDGRRVKEDVPHCLKPGDWRDSSWSGQVVEPYCFPSLFFAPSTPALCRSHCRFSLLSLRICLSAAMHLPLPVSSASSQHTVFL